VFHDISFPGIPRIERCRHGAGNPLSAWLTPKLKAARLRRDKYKSK